MINVGITTQYQGDPISVYIFILVLEVLFFFWLETIKRSKVS